MKENDRFSSKSRHVKGKDRNLVREIQEKSRTGTPACLKAKIESLAVPFYSQGERKWSFFFEKPTCKGKDRNLVREIQEKSRTGTPACLKSKKQK